MADDDLSSVGDWMHVRRRRRNPRSSLSHSGSLSKDPVNSLAREPACEPSARVSARDSKLSSIGLMLRTQDLGHLAQEENLIFQVIWRMGCSAHLLRKRLVLLMGL